MKKAAGTLMLGVLACGPIEDPTLHPAHDPATAAAPPTKPRTPRNSERSASHERIYEVAASGGRRPDATTGRLTSVGNTVDVSKPSYDNSIGAAQLAVVWRDPDFDPDVSALYYGRAIEIPTPRWSTYDAVALGIPPPEPTSLQERAVTSAIWYDASR